MFSVKWVSVATSILSVAASLTSCADQQQSRPSPSSTSLPPGRSQFTNWPTQGDEFRFHWSASPGIDLTTGPTVPLRAYVESYLLVRIADDESAVYPGFLRATPENVDKSVSSDQPIQLMDVRPSPQTSNAAERGKRVTAGYQPTHILSLDPRGEGYRATICIGLYSVYQAAENKKDRYVSALADPNTGQAMYTGEGKALEGGVDVWAVELTDKDPRAGATASPVDSQIGPLPAPVDDVFGNWFITGRSSGLWGLLGDAEDVVTPDVHKQCVAAMPDDAASREAMANGFHPSPPPHGEAIPGWPKLVN